MLACGAFLVFVGLMLSPSTPPSRRGVRKAAPTSAPLSPEVSPTAVAVAALPSAAVATVAVEERAPGSRLDSVFEEVEVLDEVEDEAEAEVEVEDEVEVDELDDATESCVDGDPVAMPEAVLASDADAVCMADLTRASERAAAVIELKPELVAEQESAGLQHAESAETIDGGAAVATIARAETEEIPGEIDADIDEHVDAVVQLPAADDRALDSLSLFHGIGDDRWISTGDRG